MKIEITAVMMILGLALGTIARGDESKSIPNGTITTSRTAKEGDWTKITGTVDSIEPGNHVLRLKTAKGNLKELTLTDKTTATRDSKTIPIDQIVKGDKVKLLRYNKTNHHIQRIEIGA